MTVLGALLRSIAVATLFVVASCGGGGGGGGGPSASPPSGGTTTPTAGGEITLLTVNSKNTGVAYPITVYVPTGGDTGTPTPVIYLLDAETRFATILPVLQASGVRATLVAVSNTGADRRQVDFLEPGADPYYAFLTQELKPVIESKYHVDPNRSVLSGHSSGGLFAMYAFFKDAPANRPYFAILAEDGSYWQQPDLVLVAEAAMYAANPSRDIPVTLIMGGDAMGNLAYMDPLYQQVLSRHYTSLKIAERSYNVGHVQMDAPFMADVLPILFPTKN